MSEEMKALREQLLRDERSGYDVLDAAQLAEMEAYCADYKAFLTNGKTERLSVREAVAAAEAKGFVPYRRGMELKAGDRVYTCNRGKGLMLAVMGRESLAEGVQIAAAHIDSPRLDLKPNPLYEDSGLAYFKTHYYGGIRKYQWVTIPLQLRGVVVKKDGSRQSFDRQKVLGGMIRACEKRPVPLAELEKIAEEIEQDLQNSMEREVSTEDIGEKVMDRLRTVDQVAYVRFASVYRQFKDIDTFMTELNKLLAEK